MKITSEITGKEYATVAECLAAEKAFEEKKLNEKSEKQKSREVAKKKVVEINEQIELKKKEKEKKLEEFNAINNDLAKLYCNRREMIQKYSDSFLTGEHVPKDDYKFIADNLSFWEYFSFV